MRWCRVLSWLTAFVVVMLAGVSVGVTASPDWLASGRRQADEADASVWLVLAGEDDAKPFAGMETRPVNVLVGKAAALESLRFDVRLEGETFRFGWTDISHVLLYTRPQMRLSGNPAVLAYAPIIYMADGQPLTEGYRSLAPKGALFPAGYTFKTRRVISLHGKTKVREENVKLSRHVLAVASSRSGAEAARCGLLELAAASELNRVHIGWDDPTPVFTASGRHIVRAFWQSKTTLDGSFSSFVQKTRGAFGVEVDTGRYSYDFSHSCLSSSAPHVPRCPDHPRINKWVKDDAPVGFEALFAGHNGVTLFFMPESPPAVEFPSMFNVGISYKE